MATMVPDSTVAAPGLIGIFGAATAHAAADASTSSWFSLTENDHLSYWVGTMSASGAAVGQLVECTVGCDHSGSPSTLWCMIESPAPVWNPPSMPGATIRVLSHGEVGNPSLAQFWAMYPDSPGMGAKWRASQADADALKMRVMSVFTGSSTKDVNNLRVTTTLLTRPTAAVIAPTGTISGNRATVIWTTTASSQRAWDVRIYTQAVYSTGGFDPANPAFGAFYSKAVNDVAPYSGLTSDPSRPWTSLQHTTSALPPGVYRAYVRSGDTCLPVMPGEYTNYSPWVFSAFTVVDALPVAEAPLTPPNIRSVMPVRDRLWNPHEAVASAWLYPSDGSSPKALTVTGGSVRYDGTAKTRATMSLECANSELVPSGVAPFNPNQTLHPFGSYIHLARGIGDDLVGLGVFRVDQVRMARGGDPSTVRVTGSDFSAYLDDSRFTYARTRQDWTTGSAVPNKVTDVAAAICAEAGLAFVLGAASSAVVVANYLNQQTDNRLDALNALADQLGWVVFALDEAYGLGLPGAIYFGPDLDASVLGVATFVEGDTATLIVDADYVLDRKDVYDLAVAYSPDGLYVSGAFDANPDSPIRRGGADILQPAIGAGPLAPGGKAIFFSSPTVLSQAGADAAARTILTSSSNLLQPIQLNGVVDPAIRPGMGVDLVLFNDTVTTRQRVVQCVIPLGPQDHMSLTVSGLASFVTASN